MAQLNAACRDKFSGHDELRPRNPRPARTLGQFGKMGSCAAEAF